MQTFQRARKPEEKDLRRRAILGAARELAHEKGPIELGLNELGRRSGVSKPNIYRYFESREDVLLHLLLAEQQELAQAVELAVEGLGDDSRAVSACIAKAYLSRPLLCQLIGMAAPILEHNVSAEAITSAKLTHKALAERVVNAIRKALPWLSADDARWALAGIELYVAGLWPAANPSTIAAEVLERPELSMLKPDAERDLVRLVHVMLAGLRPGQRPGSAAPPPRS